MHKIYFFIFCFNDVYRIMNIFIYICAGPIICTVIILL